MTRLHAVFHEKASALVWPIRGQQMQPYEIFGINKDQLISKSTRPPTLPSLGPLIAHLVGQVEARSIWSETR
jgi:hypothetical protein